MAAEYCEGGWEETQLEEPEHSKRTCDQDMIEHGAFVLELGLLEQRDERNRGKPNDRGHSSPYTSFNRFV